MPGIPAAAMGTRSPRAPSHPRLNLISSDCELLIRAPSDRRSLFSVCDAIRAVISTACEWCTIMPCMKSTFAGDRGGSVALVDGGSVLLGLPGAPCCTTTGFAGSVCPAHIPDKMPAEATEHAEALARNLPHSIKDSLAE